MAFILWSLVVSCVQSMEELESTAIAGAWAVVDDDDMASRFLVFDHGYLYEYNSGNEYFVHDCILWGAVGSPNNGSNKYRYSFQEGFIHYQNYYKNVHTSLTVDGNVMMLGEDRCLRISDVKDSEYSKILFSEANKLDFLGGGEEIEWEYEIENPVDGFELAVAEAPVWCGGAEGVRVEDGKISFSVQPMLEDLSGRFIFTYPSALDVEVIVNLSAPAIILAERNNTFDYDPGTYSFKYVIKNPIEGAQMEIECDEDWVTDIHDDGGTITYSITANTESGARYAYIHMSYCEAKALYSLTQTFAYTRIYLTETSEILTYEAGVHSFDYRINDPLYGIGLQAVSDVDWIGDINIKDGEITYAVDCNNSGAVRSGHITLTYNDQKAEYTVTQSYSRGYAFWVGDWIFTGADGYTQKVTLSPEEPDKSFLMTGFLGISESVGIHVDWDEDKQIWKISSQKLGKLTVPSGWRGDAWLYGMSMSDYSWIGETDVPICIGQVSEDGSLTAIAEESHVEAPYNRIFKPDTMFVIAYKGYDNQVYRYLQEKLNFPFIITPADAE